MAYGLVRQLLARSIQEEARAPRAAPAAAHASRSPRGTAGSTAWPAPKTLHGS
jgi:hypothetical protein